MNQYVCLVCGYIYDESENEGVHFEDIHSHYRCPECDEDKDSFTVI